MDTAFAVAVRNALTSWIGRIVLGLYTVLVVPLMPSIINFTNGFLGYDLTDAQVNSYATKASLAVGALAAVWLVNSGLFERAALLAKTALDKIGEVEGPDGLPPAVGEPLPDEGGGEVDALGSKWGKRRA